MGTNNWKWFHIAKHLLSWQTKVGRRFMWPTTYSKYKMPGLDEIVKVGNKRLNPSQKSVEMIRWFIRHFCGKDEAVLSLCDGTGTTCAAAVAEGRAAAGVDYCPEMHYSACERLKRLRETGEAMILNLERSSKRREDTRNQAAIFARDLAQGSEQPESAQQDATDLSTQLSEVEAEEDLEEVVFQAQQAFDETDEKLRLADQVVEKIKAGNFTKVVWESFPEDRRDIFVQFLRVAMTLPHLQHTATKDDMQLLNMLSGLDFDRLRQQYDDVVARLSVPDVVEDVLETV